MHRRTFLQLLVAGAAFVPRRRLRADTERPGPAFPTNQRLPRACARGRCSLADGRDRQPDAGDDRSPDSVRAALADPERRLLGAAQERWLRDELEAGQETVWQVVGQEIMEMHRRGWLCVTLTRERCTGEWHLVDGVRHRDYEVRVDQALSVAAGDVRHGLVGARIAGDVFPAVERREIARDAGSCSA